MEWVRWNKGRYSCRESLPGKNRTDEPLGKSLGVGEQQAGGNWVEMAELMKGRKAKGQNKH